MVETDSESQALALWNLNLLYKPFKTTRDHPKPIQAPPRCPNTTKLVPRRQEVRSPRHRRSLWDGPLLVL